MKILLLTPNVPYPLSEGGKIAQYAVIDALRNYCTIILAVPVYSNEHIKDIEDLQQCWQNVEIKIIQLFPDEQPSFTTRTKNFFRRNIKKLYNSLISSFNKNANDISHPSDVSYLIKLFEIKQRKFIDEVNSIISLVKPDIVQIDFLDFIDLVLLIPNHIKKVFVHHELRFARLQTFFEVRSIKATIYDDYVIEKVKQEELAFLRRYDFVFVFSEEDKQQLVAEELENVYTAPFPVLDDYFIPVTFKNAEIKNLIFVGAENHSPNKDAVEWYISEIAREINKVQKVVLHVIGNWSQKTKDTYTDNSNIYFAGFVENLIEYCRQSIMIVPVRIGSGIRAKILYAMAQGIPVISTSLGCEGIKARNKENILIADEPEAFAVAFKYIVENKNETLRLIRSAQQMVRQNYSEKTVAALRMKYFEQLLSNRSYA